MIYRSIHIIKYQKESHYTINRGFKYIIQTAIRLLGDTEAVVADPLGVSNSRKTVITKYSIKAITSREGLMWSVAEVWAQRWSSRPECAEWVSSGIWSTSMMCRIVCVKSKWDRQ
ncbi:unnamed protein product [Medioppia subpectinata]|uniref:Uncharacterized protein n=1 Tax=Medioppia subpectinata TaxID=1979941 RepID=A0A7R9LIA7_9ACAR|nr:unnamed protein product [Medioppia subpectinata]CAG2119108.1 unnamed protein product [Medioppia subpectinata]